MRVTSKRHIIRVRADVGNGDSASQALVFQTKHTKDDLITCSCSQLINVSCTVLIVEAMLALEASLVSSFRLGTA